MIDQISEARLRMSSETGTLKAYRMRARNTNVNDVTLLATDYLNHFNEALMLAELVMDMPDMLDDFIDWSPCSYKDHFAGSGIADRELAIEAFAFSPAEYKQPFEITIRQLDSEIVSLQRCFGTSEGSDGGQKIRVAAENKCKIIRELIDNAGAIINGKLRDTQFESTDAANETEAANIDQDEINALFG
jgi:hypothetical protein|tara:strand:- start:681 stop:1247 length:567 start_codon:yes stop_codon:yes gene_type:complete